MSPVPQRHYEILIEGILDPCWRPHFHPLRLAHLGRVTVLIGPIADQAALHGVLDRVRDLGLTLISVRQVEGPGPESTETN